MVLCETTCLKLILPTQVPNQEDLEHVCIVLLTSKINYLGLDGYPCLVDNIMLTILT